MILRTAPDRDQYMIWSHVASRPTWIGTRAELLALAGCNEVDAVAKRIAQADRTGSSSVIGDGRYDDRTGLYLRDFGLIPRSELAAFADATATYWNTINRLIRSTAQEAVEVAGRG